MLSSGSIMNSFSDWEKSKRDRSWIAYGGEFHSYPSIELPSAGRKAQLSKTEGRRCIDDDSLC